MGSSATSELERNLLSRPWPQGRRPLDVARHHPVGGLHTVSPPKPIATKFCSRRHPNNPDSDTCGVCRTALDRATPVVDLSPRPVARLLLEDGTSLEVGDRLTVGRSPIATDHDTLTVAGRRVSRQHFSLDVEGWQLTIQDAGSTNGTFLARTGERGRCRVPTDRSIAVAVGDTIHFGTRQMLVVSGG